MKRTLLAAGLVCLLFTSGAARAQATNPVYTFAAVDAVDWNGYLTLKVTGVLQGEAAPTTVSVSAGEPQASACERKALLAMSKPGLFLFKVSPVAGSAYTGCSLIRATP